MIRYYKKGAKNDNDNKLILELELEICKDKEYKVEAVQNNIVNTNTNKTKSLLSSNCTI